MTSFWETAVPNFKVTGEELVCVFTFEHKVQKFSLCIVCTIEGEPTPTQTADRLPEMEIFWIYLCFISSQYFWHSTYLILNYCDLKQS